MECANAWSREFRRAYTAQTGTHYAYRYKRQRTCVECGATWTTARADAKFCSNACQAAHEHGPDRMPKSPDLQRKLRRHHAAATRLARAAKGTRGTRVLVAGWCAKCGKASAVVRRVPAVTFFCSEDCRRRERSVARRAGRGQVNRQAIYRRDSYRCRIPQCLFGNRQVAVDRKVPHPKAPVLDHVIPPGEARRLGMTDEEINAPANLRCAHFLCNSTRRELGGNDQLALMG